MLRLSFVLLAGASAKLLLKKGCSVLRAPYGDQDSEYVDSETERNAM